MVTRKKLLPRGTAQYRGEVLNTHRQSFRREHLVLFERAVMEVYEATAPRINPNGQACIMPPTFHPSVIGSILEMLFLLGTEQTILAPDRIVFESASGAELHVEDDTPASINFPKGPVLLTPPANMLFLNIPVPAMLYIRATPAELSERLAKIGAYHLAHLVSGAPCPPQDQSMIMATWRTPKMLDPACTTTAVSLFDDQVMRKIATEQGLIEYFSGCSWMLCDGGLHANSFTHRLFRTALIVTLHHGINLAGSPLSNGTHHITAPEQTSAMHLRQAHFRNLRADCFYKGKHSSLPPGSRWIQVKGSVVRGREGVAA